MKFQRLVVGGFGPLKAGLTLEMGPGFNLVLARNEAGKTTLAELFTSLLYGFGKRRGGAHPLAPWSGGEVGGRTQLPPGQRPGLPSKPPSGQTGGQTGNGR